MTNRQIFDPKPQTIRFLHISPTPFIIGPAQEVRILLQFPSTCWYTYTVYVIEVEALNELLPYAEIMRKLPNCLSTLVQGKLLPREKSAPLAIAQSISALSVFSIGNLESGARQT